MLFSITESTENISVKRELPGDIAVWMLILVEITTFGLMFLAFSWMRAYERDSFLLGQELLHPLAGLINTIALLTGSYFVAQAVMLNRKNEQTRAAYMLLAGIGAALVYVFVKLWEYWQLGSAGYGLHGDHFFMAYFLLTGFHLLHVLLGIVILGVMANKLFQQLYGSNTAVGLESGAVYWHMVDLIWILLFPIIYVIK